MSHFAKRHYEAVALVLQKCKPQDGYTRETVNWQHIRNELADMFARDNGQFKRDRFERACHPGANVRNRKR